MGAHSNTIDESGIQQRLLAEMAFVGFLMVGFLVVSCPMLSAGARTTPTMPVPVDGSVLAAVYDEDPLDGDADGSDAKEEDLVIAGRTGRLVGLENNPLDPFFAALGEVKETGSGLVRVLHYGDSHTAADILTTEIRRGLQLRFGDGGRGFVFAGIPWRSYRPRDVEVGAQGAWETQRVLVGAPPAAIDGLYGLGGLSLSSSTPHSSARIATARSGGFGRRVSSFEVFYLRQPGGGRFDVRIDGKRQAVVATNAGQAESGFARFELDEGAHEIELRVRGDGEVRLFGVVLENDGPGVVYDTLGVNGGFFHTPLGWNADLLDEQVARRDPDLIIAMYGANDVDSRTIDPGSYGRQVARTMDRLRAGAPRAACLLLGPTDRHGGRILDEETSQLDWIIAVQEQTAAAIGCGFLDLRELMGGAKSFDEWRYQGLAQPDGIHLTVRGYEHLGRAVAAELLAAHADFMDDIDSPAAGAAPSREEQ